MSASRSCHSVCPQISPSAWTSGHPEDVAEVAERVAAGTGGRGAGARRRRRRRPGSRSARERRRSLPARLVTGEMDVGDAGRVGAGCLGSSVVERVPVAPCLAHRAGMRGVEGAEALGVGHEAARHAVRVLVVDVSASLAPESENSGLGPNGAGAAPTRKIDMKPGSPSGSGMQYALSE